MKVSALRKMLLKADPNDTVKIWDPESEQWEPVTGMTYAGRDKIVQLYSDEP